jgi:replication initiation protein RepC
VHAIDWLFRFTQPQDWGAARRPIVWPSASLQQEALGLSSTGVKAINRALGEAGLITMKDSPNGKRYGHRDSKGNIIEAYGFDLSPIAQRHAEFARIAAEGRARRTEFGRLRRRATIARNGITQILETAAENGGTGEEWTRLSRETKDIARALPRVERPEEFAVAVESLERRQRQARERLEDLVLAVAQKAREAVDSDPLGTENSPHITYNLAPNPDKDTVIAQEQESGGAVVGGSGRGRPERPETGKMPGISPDELIRIMPRLAAYLKQPYPSWPQIVDAAPWLAQNLDVSKPLWGEACLVMGREQAAIAIAIVSAKDPGHFRTTPGGYFRGMVEKAKTGKLDLNRTLWAMRQALNRDQGGGRKADGTSRYQSGLSE